MIRGVGDGSPFEIDVSYLEGRKHLRINGVARPCDPAANSYEHVLTTSARWFREVDRDRLMTGLYPNPRFTQVTYQLSAALWRSCRDGAEVGFESADRLISWDAAFPLTSGTNPEVHAGFRVVTPGGRSRPQGEGRPEPGPRSPRRIGTIGDASREGVGDPRPGGYDGAAIGHSNGRTRPGSPRQMTRPCPAGPAGSRPWASWPRCWRRPPGGRAAARVVRLFTASDSPRLRAGSRCRHGRYAVKVWARRGRTGRSRPTARP